MSSWRKTVLRVLITAVRIVAKIAVEEFRGDMPKVVDRAREKMQEVKEDLQK